ncbi:hypothetical protein CLOLEP_03731 [[Clostridium] leptum DSM 753]|uniref:Uncharacterized protein n=1 Tax=[Clostridium] leptum DSM 753 TaxID=428125 RepID=A7VYQ3_9FIRM|nr:hypothetical protein CLOLEP_03731 [[Clostridium] leptum DSM 753]
MGRFCPGDSFSRGLPAFLLLLKFFENKKKQQKNVCLALLL